MVGLFVLVDHLQSEGHKEKLGTGVACAFENANGLVHVSAEYRLGGCHCFHSRGVLCEASAESVGNVVCGG